MQGKDQLWDTSQSKGNSNYKLVEWLHYFENSLKKKTDKVDEKEGEKKKDITIEEEDERKKERKKERDKQMDIYPLKREMRKEN